MKYMLAAIECARLWLRAEAELIQRVNGRATILVQTDSLEWQLLKGHESFVARSIEP